MRPTPPFRNAPRSRPATSGHRYYVPLPKNIPGPLAAGKNASHFRQIEGAVLPRKVNVNLSAGLDQVEVLVEEQDEKLFREIKEKLEHLFASLYRGRKACNRVMLSDGPGTRSDVSVQFSRYEGNLLKHYRGNPGCQQGTYTLRSKQLSYNSSGSLDNEEGQDCSTQHLSSSLLLSCSDVIEELHDGLKWMQNENESRLNGKLRGRLEIRFGRKIWYSLPREVVEKDANLIELKGLLDEFKYCGMNTCIDDSNVSSLRKELKSYCGQGHTVEIYDFDITLQTSVDPRMQVGVRVFSRGDGTLEVIRVKTNQTKVTTFDIMCLQRQHDFRVELSCHDTVQKDEPEFSAITELVKSMSIATPGRLTFQPCTNMANIKLVRYKTQHTYVLEETLLITLSDVKEYEVDLKHIGRENQGELVDVELDDPDDHHWELETNSILWECTFAKATGQTIDEALLIYMEHQSVDPAVLAAIPQHWDPEDIITQQGLEDILRKMDWLNELLEH